MKQNKAATPPNPRHCAQYLQYIVRLVDGFGAWKHLMSHEKITSKKVKPEFLKELPALSPPPPLPAFPLRYWEWFFH